MRSTHQNMSAMTAITPLMTVVTSKHTKRQNMARGFPVKNVITKPSQEGP